jgi:hypothetical protein
MGLISMIVLFLPIFVTSLITLIKPSRSLIRAMRICWIMPLALGSFLLSYSTWECLSSSDMGSVGTILAWAVLPLIWVYSLAMLISCKNTEELVQDDNMGKFICRFCQTTRIHAMYCGPFYLSCVLWGVFLYKMGSK